MTIKKLAIRVTMLYTMAILLTATQAQAKVYQWGGPVQQFCGDRYCGQIEPNRQTKTVYRSRHRSTKITSHKERGARRIRVASIDANASMGISSGLVSQAQQYMGMTAGQIGVRHSQWCSAFIRKLTNASGVDDRAISWLNKPRTSGSIGSIAVMRHHVGIVTGYDNHGNPILISGNHRRRVGIGAYPKHRILAYVTP